MMHPWWFVESSFVLSLARASCRFCGSLHAAFSFDDTCWLVLPEKVLFWLNKTGLQGVIVGFFSLVFELVFNEWV